MNHISAEVMPEISHGWNEAEWEPKHSIALCHEWLTTFGGSEQVARRIVDALDIQDVYTCVGEQDLIQRLFGERRVEVISRWGRSRIARRHWQWFLPLMARAWGQLDLTQHDIVVTSSHACVNAIRTRPDALHIAYCHTPMRYAWDWSSELGRLPAVVRPWWPTVARRLKSADRRWAQEVTLFLANSTHVAERIRSYYGRASVVLYPPIDTTYWTPGQTEPTRDYFLFAGRLVAYKQPQIALRAAESTGARLVIAGSGAELRRLKGLASPLTEFVESPSRAHLRELYRNASALVFPGVEDFGMTLVEAQACGTPVLAFDRGGAREAVVDGFTGRLYPGEGVAALATELRRFDPAAYSVPDLVAHAGMFDAERFDAALRRIVDAAVKGGSIGVASSTELYQGARHNP